MSKLNDMSLKEIIEQIDLLLKENDILFFSTSEAAIKEFQEKFKGRTIRKDVLEKFLIDNEENIDKEKFVLLVALNYVEAIQELESQKASLSQNVFQSDDAFVRLANIKVKMQGYQEKLANARKIGKDIKKHITAYYYDKDQGRGRIYVLDPKEIIDGKKINRAKSVKRFDKIDKFFMLDGAEDNLGLEYVIQCMLLSDLRHIFPDENFGENIRTMILENEAVKNGTKTRQQLEELKKADTLNEYEDVIYSMYSQDILPNVKETLREYAQYIDLDKLLLICAYRFNEWLEEGTDTNNALIMKDILNGILNNIEDKKAKFVGNLEIKKEDDYEIKQVEYGVQDIKKCLGRFGKNGYIKSKEIEEYREKVFGSEISLLELPKGADEVVFTPSELEQIAILSEDNLLFVAHKLEWEAEKIVNSIKIIGNCRPGVLRIFIENKKIASEELIQLYEMGIISDEVVRGFEDIVDLSTSINFCKLNEYYNSLKQNPKDEELEDRYNKFVNLYKTVLLTNKSEEEIREASEFAIQEIIENYEGKEYDRAIEEYYRNGIIMLDSIVEWSDEELIIQLHTEGIISLEDIEEVAKKKKISTRCITKIYEEAIWDNNFSEEQRVSILATGLISKQTIEALYRKTLISNEDLRILSDKGIISENERKRIIESLGMEEAEANATICLSIDGNIQKIQSKEREEPETSYNYAPSQRKDKIIISPNARDELFRLLGAKRVQTSKIDEDSPFYNYEFYAILGDDGKIHLDTPIIAERYFEDKETQRKFATDNATYFFRYRDLMVLSNYTQKDEVVSKKENAVFRSNHTIANESRKGNWASSVIANVVRTMLASDLKEYNNENQKLIILAKIREMYSMERMKEIFELENEIDSGKHLYGIIKKNKHTNLDDSEEVR